MPVCQHPRFHAWVLVNRLADSGRFQADVRVTCATCGHRFQFLGLPTGVNLDGACTDVTGTTMSVALYPEGQRPPDVDGPRGFVASQVGQ